MGFPDDSTFSRNMVPLEPFITALLQKETETVQNLLLEGLIHSERVCELGLTLDIGGDKSHVGIGMVSQNPVVRAARFVKVITYAHDRFRQMLAGGSFFRPWTPSRASASEEIVKHMEFLNIPTINDAPCLLCHRLGEMVPFGFDAKSQEDRLKTIFVKTSSVNKFEHTMLFNTAGAGKTRLVLEGLCKNWGFYFTCQQQNEECGSSDVIRVIEEEGHLEACGLVKRNPNDQEILSNTECAERCFTAVLAARVLVFLAMLSAYEAHLRDKSRRSEKVELSVLRKIWLFAQLDTSLLVQPGGESDDLFAELSTLLCHVSETFALHTLVKSILGEGRRFLQALGASQGPNEELVYERVHFFCVVDEAQSAASAYPDAFRSHQNKDQRPALRAMLQNWAKRFGVIVTGTSLNLTHITAAISSSVGKKGNVQKIAVNDTGGFTDHAKIDAYMEYYLPPGYSASSSGKELRIRAKYWLGGRPRFVASFMETLIRNDFQSPHRLLTLYIKAITGGFVPNDATDWEAMEEIIPSSILGRVISFDFERANQLDHRLLTQMCKVVNSSLLEGRSSTLANAKVDVSLVEATFARIQYNDSEPVLDESLAHLAARVWTNKRYSRHEYFISDIDKHAPSANGLEQYTALFLADAFQDFTPLSTFFRFEEDTDKRELSDQKARLVSCWLDSQKAVKTAPVRFPFKDETRPHSSNAEGDASSPSKIIGFTSRDPSDDLEWLEFGVNAPFLFPLREFGPDLLFRLQLESGKLITVALQVKYLASGNASLTDCGKLQSAIDSVSPKRFWKNKKDEAYAPILHSDIHERTLKALDKLPGRFRSGDKGYHSLISGIFAFPAVEPGSSNNDLCEQILQRISTREVQIDKNHEFFVMPSKGLKTATAELKPLCALEEIEKFTLERQYRQLKRKDRDAGDIVQPRDQYAGKDVYMHTDDDTANMMSVDEEPRGKRRRS
ncbi:hypothetical protein H0H93_004890 [Arthromyces matolae]|nr:hypothetical protein H0H93_004890 [Arthromyces matolae]